MNSQSSKESFLICVQTYNIGQTDKEDSVYGARQDTGELIQVYLSSNHNKNRVSIAKLADPSSKYHVPAGGNLFITSAVNKSANLYEAGWAKAITKDKLHEQAIIAPLKLFNKRKPGNSKPYIDGVVLDNKIYPVSDREQLKETAFHLFSSKSSPWPRLNASRGIVIRIVDTVTGKGWSQEFMGNGSDPNLIWNHYYTRPPLQGKQSNRLQSILASADKYVFNDKNDTRFVVQLLGMSHIFLNTFNLEKNFVKAENDTTFIADHDGKPRLGYVECAIGFSVSNQYTAQIDRFQPTRYKPTPNIHGFVGSLFVKGESTHDTSGSLNNTSFSSGSEDTNSNNTAPTAGPVNTETVIPALDNINLGTLEDAFLAELAVKVDSLSRPAKLG